MKLAAVAAAAALALTAPVARAEEKPEVADSPPGPSASEPALRMLVPGNTRFALDLYRRLAPAPGNLFLSPHSLSTALAMAYAGAKGETRRQMAAVLHLPASQDSADRGFRALDESLTQWLKDQKGVTLTVANRLWGQKGYEFRQDFLEGLENHYGAGLATLDFRANAELARTTINRWVEQGTRDRIRDLIKPGMIGRDTRLVLTNAVYFKGAWAEPFPAAMTKPGAFTLATGEKVQAPLMNQKQRYAFGSGDGWQALEIPYEGNRLAMLVVLPGKADGLSALEQSLTPERLDSILAAGQVREVIVTMPRWKSESEFGLRQQLSALGMDRAFSPAAEFGGMTDAGDIQISEVVHKAFVEVTEKGTEAAAATGAVMAATAAAPDPKPPVIFRADHPFLFVLRDTQTGAILFLGRLMKP